MFLRPFPRGLSILIVVIAVVNFLAIHYAWYWRMRWFDMPMHFLGGLWLAGTMLWFRFFSSTFLLKKRSVGQIFGWGVGAALGVGLGWEIYEASVGMVATGKINAISDTLSDLCFDALGGLVGSMIVWWRMKK